MKAAVSLTLALALAVGSLAVAQEKPPEVQGPPAPPPLIIKEKRYNPGACPSQIVTLYNNTRAKLSAYDDNWDKADVLHMTAFGIDRYADYKVKESDLTGGQGLRPANADDLRQFCENLAKASQALADIPNSSGAEIIPTPQQPEGVQAPEREFARFNVRVCQALVTDTFFAATKLHHQVILDENHLEGLEEKTRKQVKMMTLRQHMSNLSQAGLVYRASYITSEWMKENSFDLENASPEDMGRLKEAFCTIAGHYAQSLQKFIEENDRLATGLPDAKPKGNDTEVKVNPPALTTAPG
jgi:hypothetical protein